MDSLTWVTDKRIGKSLHLQARVLASLLDLHITPQMSSSLGTCTKSPSLTGFSLPLAQRTIFACFCPHFTDKDTEIQGWRMVCPGPPSRAPKPSSLPVHTSTIHRDASLGQSWRKGEALGREGFQGRCTLFYFLIFLIFGRYTLEELRVDQSLERTYPIPGALEL